MLPISSRPPQELLLEWIGEVMQGYEYRYEQYGKAISELASFYNAHGYKMMVLKGYACSLDWPKPNHRPCGDIDIWQFGKQKEADAILVRERRIKIDASHHHHTVFDWDDFFVENHYDFINVYGHRSSVELENILKELGQEDSFSTCINGEKVYLPSPNLHALFLLRHMMCHFAAAEITMRQLLDWAFFVEKHTKDIDWIWLRQKLDYFGMLQAFNVFNAICVEDLGFESQIFSQVQFSPFLKERVLAEIISPEFANDEPSFLIARMIFKLRRWHVNSWKHQICFRDSTMSAFWTGLWAHILKPRSI